MRTGKSLLGVAVVGQADGIKLGNVRDLIFDHETDRVLALVLGERDLFGLIDAQIVPWSQIHTVGKDVLFAQSAASKMRLHDDEATRTATGAGRETILSGTQILTTDGKHLGTLADMCIEETTGRVLGYEVSGGFISDTLHGKKFLPAPPTLTVGQDAAIASPEAAALLK
jgi:uncharacterized protein YrrD